MNYSTAKTNFTDGKDNPGRKEEFIQNELNSSDVMLTVDPASQDSGYEQTNTEPIIID